MAQIWIVEKFKMTKMLQMLMIVPKYLILMIITVQLKNEAIKEAEIFDVNIQTQLSVSAL